MSESTNFLNNLSDVLRSVSGKPKRKHFTSAVVLAAGSSTRMGGESKQFIDLCGIPVVARTVMTFNNCKCIDEIIIVCKKEELPLYDDFASKYDIKKPLIAIEGGSTRQESARIGVDNVSDKSKFIAIHDAARCLITEEMIERVCRGAYLYDGAILAVKAVDTVKIADKKSGAFLIVESVTFQE